VASKPAPYSPHRDAPLPGDNVALVIRDRHTRQGAVYAPGLGSMEPALWQAMQEAACVLVDGTFWSDDELSQLGISTTTARAMGHAPLGGPGGTLEALGALRRPRVVLVHVNNTNPMLPDAAPERREVEAAGVAIAYDGMRIAL